MRKILKKTTILSFKLLIGILSFWLIYNRLITIPQLKEQCLFWFTDSSTYSVLIGVILLMPINWGIESYKWKSITKQVEQISYGTALKSVFSGICVGNIAPGRALEFLAKIIFFKPENRPTITILHFINGMFQMVITVSVGITSIVYKLSQNNQSSTFIYCSLIIGIIMISFFCWAIFHVHFIQQKLKFLKWFKTDLGATQVAFSKPLILKLLILSILRYVVFTAQFYFIYNVLAPSNELFSVFMSIAAYFMLTSLIPMISVIEPAIRAAIALFVFNSNSDNSVTIVLSSTFIWIINVVIPSVIGYIIILKEKIDFKSARVN